MLSSNDERIFLNRSTYQIDYPKHKVTPVAYKYEKDRQEKPVKPPPVTELVDHETFILRKKGVKVPFDVLWTPKEIIKTQPKIRFEKVKSRLDEQTEEIIKTRPRVYMAPACSFDDVPDPNMRQLLINQTYTTEWRKAEKEATANFKPVEPHIFEIGQRDNVKLETDVYKPLNENFIGRSKQWDENQLRGYCDPTTEFWLTKDPPVVCGACVDPLKNIVPTETKQIIKELIETEQLRMVHDKLSPTYAGYRPLMSTCQLGKSSCSIAQPLLSSYSTANENHKYYRIKN